MLSKGLGVIAHREGHLPHMFHAVRQMNPTMHALLVHRERGLRKFGISEGANGYGDTTFIVALNQVVHGRATRRAEVEGDFASLITDARPCPRLARDGGPLQREPRLSAKDATSPALACQAVADGDARRLTLDNHR